MAAHVTHVTDDDRKREEQKSLFLLAYAESGNVSHSCRVSGICRLTYYRWRKEDPVFRREANQAREEAIDALEYEARRRAYEGMEKPVFYRGEQCGVIREYSDTLMIVLLKAHRPKKYRERMDLNHSGRLKRDRDVTEYTDAELSAIIAERAGGSPGAADEAPGPA